MHQTRCGSLVAGAQWAVRPQVNDRQSELLGAETLSPPERVEFRAADLEPLDAESEPNHDSRRSETVDRAKAPPQIRRGAAKSGPGGSAERHFGDEQVVAARAGHVRVEDHHPPVRARSSERQGEIDQRDLETVVMQQEPLVAAIAALDPDCLLPQERVLPGRVASAKPAHERPLTVE